MNAAITKEMHVHKPLHRTLMQYVDGNGKRHAHLLDLRESRAQALLIRTAKWASLHGIQVVLLPA